MSMEQNTIITPEAQVIIELVKDGNFSQNDLCAIRMATIDSAMIKDESAERDFRVGDKVAVGERCKPRYMAGITGTVSKVNGKTVQLDMDEGQDERALRFVAGRFPKSLLIHRA